MVISRFLACTVCSATVFIAAGCADSKPLTPTLPSVDAPAANPDGSRLRATAPQTSSPKGSAQVPNLTPQLRLSNADGTYQDVDFSYEFEVYEGSEISGQPVVKSEPVAAATDTASGWTVPNNALQLGKTYAWRARALFSGTGGSFVGGSWSDVAVFKTTPPRPAGDHTGPVPCGANDGRGIIQCVADAFPDRLAKTSGGDFSDERRFVNMEFLRDRIIETAKCKGIDLGLNRKRGTEVISRDFIVLRSDRGKGGRDRGVDIASGYDDTKTRLKLTWQVFDADKNWGHPFYKDYGPVDCSGM